MKRFDWWIDAYLKTGKYKHEQPYPLHPILQIILDTRPDIKGIGELKDSGTRLKIQIWWLQYGYTYYTGVPRIAIVDIIESFRTKPTPFGDLSLPYNEFVQMNLELFPEIASKFNLETKKGFDDFLRYYYSIHSIILDQYSFFPDYLKRILLNPSPLAHNSSLGPLPLYITEYIQFRYGTLPPNQIEDFYLNIKNQMLTKEYVDEDWQNLLRFYENSQCANSQEAFAKPVGPKQKGVNLIGVLFGELGLGEDARLMSLALLKRDIPFSAYEFPEKAGGSNNDFTINDFVSKDNPYDINLFCLPPPEGFLAISQLPASFFDGRYNILYSPWELPKWPPVHEALFNIFDEIWTATDFVFRGCPTFAKNVEKMSLPVSLDHIKSKNPLGRRDFGLEDGRFYFLFMFDSNSTISRKNPLACLRAFAEAFPMGTENVGLIIKTMNLKKHQSGAMDLLKKTENDPRIKIISETLPRENVVDLFEASDAFVSLHRSEGFGRCIAEAMLLEKPVIVTGFSGNIDFTNSENSYLVDFDLVPVNSGEYFFSDNQVWAEANISHAAEQMRTCFYHKDDRERRAKKAREQISKYHSISTISEMLSERLDAIRKKLDRQF